MKALIFDRTKTDWEASRGFELADVPQPELDESSHPGDADAVLIRVDYAGVCGSDRGIWYRQSFGDQIRTSLEAEGGAYRIIGHECFGHVVAIGSSVARGGRLAFGDFVSCESHVICGSCYQCTRGQKNVCVNEKILGISTQGCFAEVLKVPAHIAWKTDTSKIRPEVAAVQEPFGNAVHAATRVPLAGKTIAVFGLGPIGLFTVLVARALGAEHIIGVDPNPISREMALRLGIDYCIGVEGASDGIHHSAAVVKDVLAATDGRGADVSFEMAGFNSSVNNAIHSTRRGGDVILFGIKSGDFTIENYDRLIVRGLTLHAVIGRQVFETWEQTRALLEQVDNKIQENIFNVILKGGIGTILPIDEFTPQIFEKNMREQVKFLIQF